MRQRGWDQSTNHFSMMLAGQRRGRYAAAVDHARACALQEQVRASTWHQNFSKNLSSKRVLTALRQYAVKREQYE